MVRWALAVTVINSVGAVLIGYVVYGRRSSEPLSSTEQSRMWPGRLSDDLLQMAPAQGPNPPSLGR
jgi:hypothetical protein